MKGRGLPAGAGFWRAPPLLSRRRPGPAAAGLPGRSKSPAARLRRAATGRATIRFDTLIPTSSSSTSDSPRSRSATHRSGGSTPACSGPRDRPGTAWAISRVVRHSQRRPAPLDRGRRPHQRDAPVPPATPTATRSTAKAARSRASTATAASSATSTTARRPSWPTTSTASRSTPQRPGRPPRRRHLVHRSRLRCAHATTKGNKGPLEIKEAVYRIDPKSGKIAKVTDDLFKPNGLCFSPDYKTLYIADTGASHYPKRPTTSAPYDVVDGVKLANGREFASMKLAMPGGEFAGFRRRHPRRRGGQRLGRRRLGRRRL